MKFRDGRNAFITEKKPEGTFRILCLGDSMIYGQGVNGHETLPARLEMLLNGAVWNLPIEVINEGHCGYSIHDEWSQFLQRGYRYQPDLIVWFLCDNDAELFGVQEDYVQHVKECWDENGVHLPYFRLAFKDISAHIKSLGIPLIVSFYYIYDNPIREKCSRIIKSICEMNGIEFIDLSVAFSGGSSAHINNTMRVSEIDGHPSEQAHQIAAQGLARYLIKNNVIAQRNNVLLGESELHDSLLKNAEEMLQAGYPADYSLYRLSQLLEWKRESRIRPHLAEEIQVSDEEFSELFSHVKGIFDLSVELLYWQSYAHVLKVSEEQFLAECLKIDSLIQSIKKTIFLTEKNLNNPELSYNIYEKRPLPEDWECIDHISELQMELDRWLSELSKVQALKFDEKPLYKRKLNGLYEEVNYGFRSVKNYINNYWNECDRIIKACQQCLSTYLSMRRMVKGKSSESCDRHALFAIEVDIHHLIKLVKLTIDMITLEPISRFRLPALRQPVTNVSVRLSGRSAKAFNLTVCIHSVVPDYPLMQDFRIAFNDGYMHTYKIDFPLFLCGRIAIRIDRPGEKVLANEEFNIEDIQVGYDQGYQLTIKKDELKVDEHGYITTPVIWLPHGLIKGNGMNDDSAVMSELYKESRYIKYEIPKEEISSENGYCSIYRFKTRAGLIFTYTQLYSSLNVYEAERPLQYGGSVHDDIRALGGGRYSNSYGGIFFSSSDNSDPKENGRVYSIHLPSYIYFLERLPETTIKQLGL